MKKLRCVFILTISITLLSCTVFKKPTHTPYVTRTSTTVFAGAAAGGLAGAMTGGIGVPVGAAIGGVAGAFVGHDITKYSPEKPALEDHLRHAGVDVIKVGEDITLVISAERLFLDHSPRLKTPGLEILNMIAFYMQYYELVAIKVSVHTDNEHSERRNLAVSRQRAQNIIDYLTMQQIDARLMVGVGYGSSVPVASNASQKGRTFNRRVEIYFRRLVRPDA